MEESPQFFLLVFARVCGVMGNEQPQIELIGSDRVRYRENTFQCHHKENPIRSPQLRRQMLQDVHAVREFPLAGRSIEASIGTLLGLRKGIVSHLHEPGRGVSIGTILLYLVHTGMTATMLALEEIQQLRLLDTCHHIGYVRDLGNFNAYQTHCVLHRQTTPEEYCAAARYQITLYSLPAWLAMQHDTRMRAIEIADRSNEDRRVSIRSGDELPSHNAHYCLHRTLTADPWKETIEYPLNISISGFEDCQDYGDLRTAAQVEWQSHDSLIRRFEGWTSPDHHGEATSYIEERHLGRSAALRFAKVKGHVA